MIIIPIHATRCFIKIIDFCISDAKTFILSLPSKWKSKHSQKILLFRESFEHSGQNCKKDYQKPRFTEQFLVRFKMPKMAFCQLLVKISLKSETFFIECLCVGANVDLSDEKFL